jgi:2-desacetyl-2-hydroxyethyl bacteriochlorophyllide A dehydrogenase
MKCLLTQGKGDLTLGDIEKPKIQPGHVILKVGYASICGTDFSIINGEGPPWTSVPVVLGHEFSGTIEEVGEKVEDVQIGDEVVVDNYISCHACYYCKKGAYFYCDHHREPGITINGGFAEYCLIPSANVVKTPPGLSLRDAVITEPTGNCLRACITGNIRNGEIVLILGCGPISALTGMICRSMGARVILLGRGERLKRFEAMGFELLINTAHENWVRRIEQEYGKSHPQWGMEAVDVVIDGTQTGEMITDSIRFLKRKGRLILIGLKKGEMVHLPRNDVVLKDIHVLGSTSGMGYFHESLQLIRKGNVDAEKIITHTFRLSEALSAYEFFKNRSEGSLKVAVRNDF